LREAVSMKKKDPQPTVEIFMEILGIRTAYKAVTHPAETSSNSLMGAKVENPLPERKVRGEDAAISTVQLRRTKCKKGGEDVGRPEKQLKKLKKKVEGGPAVKKVEKKKHVVPREGHREYLLRSTKKKRRLS